MAAQCGMSEAEFWHATPRFFWARWTAWRENRNGWEQARWIAFHIIKTVDAKGQFKRLTDIHRFPWDAEPEPVFEDITREEMQRFSDEADIILAKTQPALWAKIQAARKQEESNGNPTT